MKKEEFDNKIEEVKNLIFNKDVNYKFSGHKNESNSYCLAFDDPTAHPLSYKDENTINVNGTNGLHEWILNKAKAKGLDGYQNENELCFLFSKNVIK